jgi:signal peptidase II
MPRKSRVWLVALVVALVLVCDQGLKIWVKTHMMMHESIKVTDWFYLFFTENNGMAFGIELFDKLFLTLFRMVAVGVLIWYILRIRSFKNVRTGYLLTVGMIMAGAMGNIFDCLFYGLIFDNSYYQIATLFPSGGGYAGLFYGKVVDMFYFPLIDTVWPSWVPFVGGESFVFFRPIFNVADASISVGIVLLLAMYRKELSETTTVKALGLGKNHTDSTGSDNAVETDIKPEQTESSSKA